MTKNYKVNIIAYATVLVTGASSEEEALEMACDHTSYGDFQHDEASIKEEISENELADSKLHADNVVRASS